LPRRGGRDRRDFAKRRALRSQMAGLRRGQDERPRNGSKREQRHGCASEPAITRCYAAPGSADPYGFLERSGGPTSTGSSRPKQVFDPKAGRIRAAGSPGRRVPNTCWETPVDRPRPRRAWRARLRSSTILHSLGKKRARSPYHRLQVETQVLAAILRNFGVAKGDRVYSLYARWCQRR